jgi:hypothetical protein
MHTGDAPVWHWQPGHPLHDKCKCVCQVNTHLKQPAPKHYNLHGLLTEGELRQVKTHLTNNLHSICTPANLHLNLSTTMCAHRVRARDCSTLNRTVPGHTMMIIAFIQAGHQRRQVIITTSVQKNRCG